MARKKTPKDIRELLLRIMKYYLSPTYIVANVKARKRLYEKIAHLDKTACRYIDNIYKLANVDRINATTSDIANVWEHYGATKEQYTNNK